MSVRAATESDQDRIGEIAEAAGLFPAEYLPDMIAPGLSGGPDTWRVAGNGAEGDVVGFAFARPEELTDRTWNLLAIAVHPESQRNGYASQLLADMESGLDARLIIIETTQLPEQATARAFYESRGYRQEGHVHDFYGDGEDKIIFRKAIA